MIARSSSIRVIAAAPGLRPWRGSQPPRVRRPGLAPRRQRRGFGPGEDHNYEMEPGDPESPRQRRGFGPGEDHNDRLVLRCAFGSRRQRRGFGPGEITTGRSRISRRSPPAAPGLRPWRDHNTRAVLDRRLRSRAAPGLRPWRGSQHQRGGRIRPVRRRSARASALARITTPSTARTATRRRRQRRGFGPGEDHNIQITGGTPPRGCLPQLAFC